MAITVTGIITGIGRSTISIMPPTPPEPTAPVIGQTGVFAGGSDEANVRYASMEYIVIDTESNAVLYGTLLGGARDARLASESNGSGERGIFAGGTGNLGDVDTIEYITMTNTGNTINFGSLIAARRGSCAVSNHTRAVITGGVFTNAMQYIVFSTPSAAIEIGDLLAASTWWCAGASNTTNNRGVISLGTASGEDVMNFITISSNVNASFFGNLSVPRYASAGTSNHTNERGLFIGGFTTVGGVFNNVIDRITISSAGDAVDFGDLAVEVAFPEAVSNGINDRAVIGGGSLVGFTEINTMEYVTISTPGNASTFGTLSEGKRATHGAVSNA